MVSTDIFTTKKDASPENAMQHPTAFERNETVRIEAFSDGVFAIAITLLVLGINVPKIRDLGGGSLGATLMKQWPHYLAFVMSFVTIFTKWVNHHRLFSFIKGTDHAFLYWNGVLLLFITFLPFPTALLAEYLLHPEATVAGAVFAGTYAAIAFAFKGLWHHASKNGRLLAENVDDRENPADHHAIPVRAAAVPRCIRAFLRVSRSERGSVPLPDGVLRLQGLADAAVGSVVFTVIQAKEVIYSRRD